MKRYFLLGVLASLPFASCDTGANPGLATSLVGTWEIIDPLPGEIYIFTFTETEYTYRYFYSGNDVSYSGSYEYWDEDTLVLTDLFSPVYEIDFSFVDGNLHLFMTAVKRTDVFKRSK
jgi:hypothetical protein